jgi:hypothetical protein
MCLALARPKLFSDRFGFLGDEQAATVVLVIDTSPSMEYTVAGNKRLDDAKARALELLDDLGESSRVAVLDTADPAAEWALSRAAARDRINDLSLRAGNRPVTDALDVAFRLFGSAEGLETDEAKPRFVYVFSDRTPASWDGSRVADLAARRDRLPDPKPRLVYVDVGVEQPDDVAVADVDVKPQAVPANRPVVLNVTVQATGQDHEAEVSCRFDGDPTAERKPVRLRANDRQIVTFERRGLAVNKFHQAEIILSPTDSLPGNNVRYATVLVRKPQKVLLLCDDPTDARLWRTAVDKQGLYECEVRSLSELRAIDKLAPTDLAEYQAVCLLSVASPSDQLWQNLDAYVHKGGGLAVAPGQGLDRDSYAKDDSAARRLLPGELVKFDAVKDGATLTDYQYQHHMLTKFRDWASQPERAAYLANRRAYQFWSVKPADGATVLIRYADAVKHPALLEKTFGDGGRGKVLLFTTPMDGRQDAGGNQANNFNDQWYYFALVNEAVRYLAGESDDAGLNHVAGPAVTVQLPLTPRFPTYTLRGPGLTGADTQVQRAETAGELRLTQPQQPGNYVLSGGGRTWETRFSLNAAPEESLLLPRVPVAAIEELFGPDSVAQVGQSKRLKDALEGQFRQPVELFPWLMILLLLALAVENLLANKFYKQPPPTEN